MAADNHSLRVFISYARRDGSVFAEELLAGLEVAGFDPYLDRRDIAAGEDWEARLGALIQGADTVVFVVTPGAVASERCGWEVKKAEALSKRIIPVVAIDVPESRTPHGLKRLNYIFFSEGHSFARALGELAKALRTDLDWIREHTRLSDMAVRWRDRDKPDVLLLRGSELEAAKVWMSGWKAPAPEPTDVHRAFIGASDSGESSRLGEERKQLEAIAAAQVARAEALKRLSRRTTIGLIGAGGLTTAAGGLAYWGNDAERRFAEARRQSVDAVVSREASRVDLAGRLSVSLDRFPAEATLTGASRVRRALDDPNTSIQDALEQIRERGVSYSTDLNGEIYLRRKSPTRRTKALVVSTRSPITFPFATFISNGVVVDSRPRRIELDGTQEAATWVTFLQDCGIEVHQIVEPTKASLGTAMRALTFSPIATPERTGWNVPRVQNAGLTPVADETQADTLAIFLFFGLGLVAREQGVLCVSDTDTTSQQVAYETGVAMGAIEELLDGTNAAASVIITMGFHRPGWPPGE